MDQALLAGPFWAPRLDAQRGVALPALEGAVEGEVRHGLAGPESLWVKTACVVEVSRGGRRAEGLSHRAAKAGDPSIRSGKLAMKRFETNNPRQN